MTKFTKEQLEYLEANVEMCEDRLGISNILCDVMGNVSGYVYGDIESVLGDVNGDVDGHVYGTINGLKWRYVKKENKYND
jgi:hypothetical protein